MTHITICRVMVATLIVGLCITGVSAQQMPFGPGGGYSGFMGMPPAPGPGFGAGPGCGPGPVKCKPMGPPPCAPPPAMGCAPYPGFDPYACPPPCAPAPIAEPALYVGYLFKDHGAGVNVQFNNGDVVGITSTRNDFDLQGVWLELMVPFALGPSATAFVSGAHLFPVNVKDIQSYQLVDGAASREWNPDIQWWELNAGLSYRFCPMVSALGGFRWSSFVVNFNNPFSQVGFAGSDDAKLTVNAYIPFFGLLAEGQPTCNSNFKAAVLGFPALPSDVEWQESLSQTSLVTTRLAGNTTNKTGYFLEALAEASTKMCNWDLGAFVRFDLIHTDRTRDYTFPGGTIQADVKFDRRNWIIGGKIGYAF